VTRVGWEFAINAQVTSAQQGSKRTSVELTDRDPGDKRCLERSRRRAACKRLGLRQVFTKPYTPRTNGKAERFIQTALREWAYARAYQNSDQRSAELLNWLHRYNWHRPHGSLKANTPISRLGLSEDNLLRLHS
jgi:transposase InsO family protein